MRGTIAYLDTSAFVKLLIEERESSALRRELSKWPDYASSTLLVTETLRSVRRSGNDLHVELALKLLDSVNLIKIDEMLVKQAGYINPPEVRSLDSIHLASALNLQLELGVFLVYDQRLKSAAEALSLPVASPV